jgi:hypothetical protein
MQPAQFGEKYKFNFLKPKIQNKSVKQKQWSLVTRPQPPKNLLSISVCVYKINQRLLMFAEKMFFNGVDM